MRTGLAGDYSSRRDPISLAVRPAGGRPNLLGDVLGALEAMTFVIAGTVVLMFALSRAGERVARERFVSHAVVDDDQSKSADPVDDSGPFVHACYCGRWGFFGYEVALLRTGLVDGSPSEASSWRRRSDNSPRDTTMKLATATVLAVLCAGACRRRCCGSIPGRWPSGGEASRWPRSRMDHHGKG